MRLANDQAPSRTGASTRVRQSSLCTKYGRGPSATWSFATSPLVRRGPLRRINASFGAPVPSSSLVTASAPALGFLGGSRPVTASRTGHIFTAGDTWDLTRSVGAGIMINCGHGVKTYLLGCHDQAQSRTGGSTPTEAPTPSAYTLLAQIHEAEGPNMVFCILCTGPSPAPACARCDSQPLFLLGVASSCLRPLRAPASFENHTCIYLGVTSSCLRRLEALTSGEDGFEAHNSHLEHKALGRFRITGCDEKCANYEGGETLTSKVCSGILRVEDCISAAERTSLVENEWNVIAGTDTDRSINFVYTGTFESEMDLVAKGTAP
ncbi:hypothetical protein FB451DRAFT_1434219 [Mycena latifolia]|nr:hypothetical protein FB451DRAFT_1434219 [Mycena latifolia]